jgi:dienelactone hydrolase
VRKIYGTHRKYSSVGYCFGAHYVLDALGDGTVDAGAFAHPAFLTDDHFANIKGASVYIGRSEEDVKQLY